MAIIPGVPGVSAHILVDGFPLVEYTDEDDAADEEEDGELFNKVTKYVECVSGANFSVSYDFRDHIHPPAAECIVSYIYMDALFSDGSTYRLNRRPRHGHRNQQHVRCNFKQTFQGARALADGLWIEKPFRFAEIKTTDDGPVGVPSPKIKSLGTVVVKLFYAQHMLASQRISMYNPIIQAESIHEKHLKGQAISHQVEFGEPRPIAPPSSSVSVRHLQPTPFATFCFRYRSRQSLQALCLIPRSPTPVALEDRPEDSLNREELLELLRRQKAKAPLEIKPEFKREYVEDYDEDDDDGDLMVLHAPTKKLKASLDADTGVETIDLTDD